MPGWLEIVKLHEGTGTNNYDGTAGREARRKLKQSWLTAKEQTGGWIEFLFPPVKMFFYFCRDFKDRCTLKEAQMSIMAVVNKEMYKLRCLGGN